MVSRRDVIVGGLIAGASGMFLRNGRVLAAAPQPSTKVNFDVPAGATDSAVHVFGDPKRYPYWQGRTYTPEAATVDQLRQFLKTLRLDRVIVVQATPYGTDNSCVMGSLRELGASARGVAIIDEKTTDASLDEMHRAGVRGIRLNIGNLGATDPAGARQRLQAGVDRIKNMKSWSVQISATAATFEALHGELMAMAMPIVVDHFGGVTVERGIDQPGLGTILNLVKSGKAYVKISNAESVSRQPDLSDLAPYAKAFVSANPQRVVWGTAWPHPTAGSVPGRKPTDLALHQQVDDGKAMNMLPIWVPAAAMRKMILVDNAARLYGF
jgi:predicted TIM-barrel fold metal-dependent hydrolase